MELNVLNEKLNVDVGKYHGVDQYRFWYIYCQLLNIRQSTLSDKDCSLMGQIITLNDAESNILSKENGRQLSEVTNISLSNLFGKCKQLAEKNFLIRREDGYYLNPSLASFKNFITTHDLPIKFTLPLKLEQEDGT